MSRPVIASMAVEDIEGNAYTLRVLGAESDTPCCGVVLPSALIAVDLPGDVVDIFANSRTVHFDVSDTPIVAMASAMAAMGGPSA